MLRPEIKGGCIRELGVGGHWLDAWLGEILREEWEAKEEKNA